MTHQNTAPAAGSTGLASLPPMIGIPTVAHLLGISRASAYRLAARDALPVPVVRIGHCLRIPTAPLLAAIALTPAPDTPNPADPEPDAADSPEGTGAGGAAPAAHPGADQDA
jgi:predicted DNA-binding transcriptional regulator AlpA